MRQTAARWSSLDALDQWGIEFPMLPETLDEPVQPTASSLAQVISSWRFSIATAWPAPDGALDQWGIEFPVPAGEFAALARYRRHGCLQARSSVLGGRVRAISQAGAWAAIVAIIVAGSALAVDPPASAGAVPPDGAPTGGQPVVIGRADSATEQPSAVSNPTLGPTPGASLPSITEQPSTISIPTLGPTPGATKSADAAIAVKPVPTVPAPAVVAVPMIQDARNYLVSRLGAKVDRHWGMSQSQCASLIFEYEARWNPHATNKTSGAYGLPQAKPASKLANWAEAKAAAAVKAGDPNTAWLYRAWRDNPVVQAEWGVDYMIERYGSPCAALAFRSGYLDDDGIFHPGVGWY